MRRYSTFLLTVYIIMLFSCNSADNKIPQIATDFCNCFNKIEKGISKSTVDIFINASNADNPQAALKEEMGKLSPENFARVNAEMTALSHADDEHSELGGCIKEVEKRYGKTYTTNQEKFGEKIIKELESRNGCTLTTAIMKLGLKMDKQK